jgi:putative ABC transport system permease protein
MGAGTFRMVLLLSEDFTQLVIIGFAMAAPLSWWALDRYLDVYTYRVEIAWWIIPVAGTLALGLTLIIVSSQAIRASVNPSASLKSE